MEKNIFKLDNEQLKGIAHAFREKVEEGYVDYEVTWLYP